MRKSVILLAVFLSLAFSTSVAAAVHLESYLGISINTFTARTDIFAPVAAGGYSGMKLWFADRLALGSEVEYLNTGADFFGVKNELHGFGCFGTVTLRVYKGFQAYVAPGYNFFTAKSDLFGTENSYSGTRVGFKGGLEYKQNLTERLYLTARCGYRYADAYMGDYHPGFTGLEVGMTASFKF